DLWFVIWNPGIILPTPAVYRRLDAIRTAKDNYLTDIENEVSIFVRRMLEGTCDLKKELPTNDLEVAALHISAEMQQWFGRLSACVKRQVRMSGSGSSFFAVAEDEEEAKKLRIATIRRVPGAIGKVVRPLLTWEC
ncbi:MAG: hypothetical protein N3A38_10330, partial [Planctomycetota bacterium]|nr:hypothetical protein [Planctomycetota bacterium]